MRSSMCEKKVFGPASTKVIGLSLNALLPIGKCEKLIFIDVAAPAACLPPSCWLNVDVGFQLGLSA
jgi:hypothetical protein